ncbi:MAG: hypothetical protein EA427_03145 [Spirochaetaceae bacterium]|nr:MAG: hypothetical protein EA427_03145 [Spirochaetaceae bacterium]
MRVFHMHTLGSTTEAMGRMEPGAILPAPVRFGLYACSPLDSSFTARFSPVTRGPSKWEPHRE